MIRINVNQCLSGTYANSSYSSRCGPVVELINFE